MCHYSGAFYYLLGNMSQRFRSKIHNIQLLLLAKYSSVTEFGIDNILEPAVEDIRKLESVCTCTLYIVHDVHVDVHVYATTHSFYIGERCSLCY